MKRIIGTLAIAGLLAGCITLPPKPPMHWPEMPPLVLADYERAGLSKPECFELKAEYEEGFEALLELLYSQFLQPDSNEIGVVIIAIEAMRRTYERLAEFGCLRADAPPWPSGGCWDCGRIIDPGLRVRCRALCEPSRDF